MKAARWWTVAAVGVLCGAMLAWLAAALTGSWVVGIVLGAALASILLGLSFQGMRQNKIYRLNEAKAADAAARRARVDAAMRATRGDTTREP